jgi:hypothetical protein
VLSLLLRQRKSYVEVAGMLGIQERAVHDRAHAALALLAPRQARALSAAERERLGEYLLGQQAPAEALETHAFLERSQAGGEWAQALADELASLAVQPLPDIPAPRGRLEPTHSPPASSRVGGAIVLGGLAVAVIVAVLLIVGGGGSHGTTHTTAASSTGAEHSASGGTQTSAGSGASTTPTTPATGTTGATGTGTSTGGTTHSKALVLTPPNPATSKAAGVAYVLTQDGKHAFYLFTKGLPALTGGAFYAVWLENTATEPAFPLGSLPAPAANGLLEGGGELPANAGSFHHMIVTRETSKSPTHPGQLVLSGAFTLAG